MFVCVCKGAGLMKISWIRRISGALLSGAIMVTLAGCAATKMASDHPLIEKNSQAAHATVYFIRPLTERVMGFPDNPLTIEFDNDQLLALAKGEYSLVHMKPREITTMTLKSLTTVGPDWRVKEMVKSQKWSFTAGATYYIVLKPVDGEFRGVYFTAEAVDWFTAKESVRQLRAVDAARRAPI